MAVIYEDTLKKQITSSKLLPVYLILGEDDFLKKTYVNKISNAVSDKDDIFNFAKFGPECNLQEVYDSLSQLPIMAEKKCVILCDYDIEHCSKTDLEKLYSLPEVGGDTAVFILWFDSVEIDYKKSSKLKKLIAAVEKAGGNAVQLNHRRIPELVKMLTDGAAKRGCKLNSDAAKYLIEIVGEEINTLQNELEKLCCYKRNSEITRDIVDKISAKTVEASVYSLSADILNGNAESALKTLDELFFMRIEPMIILYTVSSAYIDIYRVYASRKAGIGAREAAGIFGYKGREFVLERASQNLSKFDFKRLSLSIDALIDADRQLKSFGGEPRIILEQLVIRLIYIIAKGESIDKA